MDASTSAVVYARYSSHRQGEQSIEAQLTEAAIYAEQRDITIIHEYCDRAISGKTDNRDAFQQMIKDSAKGLWKYLIVWKTDRIGRNKEDIAYNKYLLKKHGIKIIYIAEHIPDTPEGIILESVIEGMAAYYSEQLSQNVRRGQRASAAKAQSIGGNLILGYMTGADKRFVIDPNTAPTVRQIFDMYASGSTCTEITAELNSQGKKTVRGNPFNKSCLHRLLTNEKYIGVYSYKDDVRIENGVPRIIDDATFYKVQEMLKINKRAPAHKWTRADYLLTEKLFCGKCGAGMVGMSGTSKTGNRYNYYSCVMQRKKQCDKKSVRQEWIENLVIQKAISIVFDDELLDFIADNTYKYYVAENTDTAYTDSLKNDLNEVERGLNNLLKAIEAGIINGTTKARMDELEARKTLLETALQAAKLKQDLSLTKERILYFLRRYREYDYSDIEAQKRLIATFINSVFVYDDHVTITFNYSGDSRTITLNEIDAGTSSKSSSAVSLVPPDKHERSLLLAQQAFFALLCIAHTGAYRKKQGARGF